MDDVAHLQFELLAANAANTFLEAELAHTQAQLNESRDLISKLRRELYARRWIKSRGFDPDGDLKLLMTSKRNPRAKTTVMHEACAYGNLEVCQYLFESGYADLVRRPSSTGASPIGVCCREGQLSAAIWLWEHGAKADVRTQNKNGTSPLIYATMYGHLHMVRWLCKMGASEDIRTKNDDGRTPMLYACISNKLHIANWLFEMGAQEDVRTPDNEGQTPLAYCSSSDDLEHYNAARWLLVHGAANSEGFDGHVDPAVLLRDIESKEARKALRKSLEESLLARESFVSLVLQAAAGPRRALSTAPARRSPFRLFWSANKALLRLIGDFAEIPFGRQLRNAREVSDFLRSLGEGE